MKQVNINANNATGECMLNIWLASIYVFDRAVIEEIAIMIMINHYIIEHVLGTPQSGLIEIGR